MRPIAINLNSFYAKKIQDLSWVGCGCGSDDVDDENADDDGVSLSRTSENEEQESHYGLQDLQQQVKGG